MKIVYFSKANFPSTQASSIHMINMCEAFTELGHEVHLICPDIGKTEAEIFNFYGVKFKFKIAFHPFPLYKGKTLIFVLSALATLLDVRPDLVISRFRFGSFLSSLMGYRIIHDFHGDDWNVGKFSFNLYRKLFESKWFIKATFNSNALKKQFLELGFKTKTTLEVLHNGSKKFDLSETIVLPGKNKTKAGYFGNLYHGRGIELIVEVAKALPDVDFIIVGGTPKDIQRLKGIINPVNIYIMGFVEPSKVYLYRNSVDLLLAPYMDTVALEGNVGNTAAYMNPIKLIEYMGSKKIILTSDLPPLREILDENKAFLLNNSDVEAWVGAIESVIENPNKYSHMAINSYDFFLNNLTWTSRASKMIKVEN